MTGRGLAIDPDRAGDVSLTGPAARAQAAGTRSDTDPPRRAAPGIGAAPVRAHELRTAPEVALERE
ncbi:hypothetical protein [Nocardia sp. NPDC057455]|uniref:hypothetical protein n=1 Tax=Nocardia sp. NPDC057455 TaxID=3346138 RepID=UPI00367213AD